MSPRYLWLALWFHLRELWWQVCSWLLLSVVFDYTARCSIAHSMASRTTRDCNAFPLWRRVVLMSQRFLLSSPCRWRKLHGRRGCYEYYPYWPSYLYCRNVLLKWYCESMPEGSIWFLRWTKCRYLFRLVPSWLLLPCRYFKPVAMRRGILCCGCRMGMFGMPWHAHHAAAVPDLT